MLAQLFVLCDPSVDATDLLGRSSLFWWWYGFRWRWAWLYIEGGDGVFQLWMRRSVVNANVYVAKLASFAE